MDRTVDFEMSGAAARVLGTVAVLLLVAAGAAVAGGPDTVCLHTPLEVGCL